MEDKRFAELLIKSIKSSNNICLEFNSNIFYPEDDRCKFSLYLIIDLCFVKDKDFESLEEEYAFLSKRDLIFPYQFSITIDENLYNLKFIEKYELVIEVNNIRQLIKDFELDIEKIELDGFLHAVSILQENYDLAEKVNQDLNLIFK